MKQNGNSFKYLLLLGISLLTIFISYFVGKRAFYYESGLSQNRADAFAPKEGYAVYRVNIKENNDNMVKLFKLLPHDTTDIVFLGTSLTQGFPLQEIFENHKLKNRGIGGNLSSDILGRLPEVTDGQPKKIFIEVGSNDLGKGIVIDSIFTNLKKIIYQIKSKTPRSEIYVQTVLPFGNDDMIKNIEAYNDLVRLYCSSNQITFIDIYSGFIKNHKMNPALTTDGTHINANGYFIWKSKIEYFVNEKS